MGQNSLFYVFWVKTFRFHVMAFERSPWMHLWGDDFETVPLLVEIFSSVPLLFLCTLSLRVSAHGAALTEKCRAIPSFVNQIPANDIDHNRQYLVRFIQDSSAGFCIRDVKLTQEMFMKQVYVVGALLSATFSALSRLLIWSQPSRHRCGFMKPSKEAPCLRHIFKQNTCNRFRSSYVVKPSGACFPRIPSWVQEFRKFCSFKFERLFQWDRQLTGEQRNPQNPCQLYPIVDFKLVIYFQHFRCPLGSCRSNSPACHW